MIFDEGELIRKKAASPNPSAAWGSWNWESASNPLWPDVREDFLVFSKGAFSRKAINRENAIPREDFLFWTKSVWEFSPESENRVGHPAPFPLEQPHRLIQLYSFKDDIVLDPFSGSGTTAPAAYHDSRKFVAYEVNED